ncbi:MAG TPA: SRPBCC family protein [Gemmatimonadales bacterium]|nr:SRPBCC family protein [Gemmatimonadales bacterium]
MAGTKTFLSGITVGAGLAYFLDPERGSFRREQLAERLTPLWDDARQVLQSGAGGSSLTHVMRYGARIGDLPGMGAATLEAFPGGLGSSPPGASVLRMAGIVLGMYGLVRRGALGAVLRTVATGMLARAAGVGGPRLGPDRRRAVDIQKTLYIDAPVEQVYAFWSNYENFPLFMSHVREVEDLGGGRSHWNVKGPGGLPIEWNATLTQQTPNEVLAWRSEAGSMLENAGMIRFTSSGGGTRVDLRLCYHPPAGGAGQAVAELLGSDPRAKLNDDLGRMKALLEATTRSEKHGKESRP